MRNDVKEVLKWQEEMVARMEQLSPRESESVMNEFRRFIEMSVTKLSAITQWIVEVVHFVSVIFLSEKMRRRWDKSSARLKRSYGQ